MSTSKSDKIKKALTSGQLVKACKVARTFRWWDDMDVRRAVEITADEAHYNFYRSIGVNIEEAKQTAKEWLEGRFL